MEEETQKSNKNTMIMIAAVVIILVLVVGSAAVLKMNNKDQAAVEAPADTGTSAGEVSPEGSVTYKDGEYSAQGEYSYHSGTESIGVSLTLKDGVVESVEVELMATSPTSKSMQEDFAANYESEVVGKSIDEINLGKISGSSLTPKGFNDAIEQIKNQAKS